MSKIFALKIEKRTPEEYFFVTLQVQEDHGINSAEVRGRLPLCLDLLKKNKLWREKYSDLRFVCRTLKQGKRGNTSIISKKQFLDLSEELKKNLNSWLNSQEFLSIKETLLRKLSNSEENRVLIQLEDVDLQRLPWSLWNIFNEYRNTEVALAPLTYSIVPSSATSIPRNKGRILAVIGDSEGINVEEDRQLILKDFSEADITFIDQLSRSTLTDYLYDEKGWDILFFAGHSSSELDEEKIHFYINKSNKLTIGEIKNALTKAIEHGLKLAIFNSCDGLGLAQSLFTEVDVYIPQLIVMREPVPDLVAQKFLEYFLKAFSGGKSLYASVREARQKLESIEKKFPCASWLPVIFQNPAEVPPTWQDLHGVRVERRRKNRMNKLRLVLAGTALVFTSIFGIKFMTETSQIGDYTSYGEEILFTHSGTRNKQRAVKLLAECKEPLRNYLEIWERETRQKLQGCFQKTDKLSNYEQAFNLLNQSWEQIAFLDPETLIYLNNALLDANKAKYHTIAAIVPIVKKLDGSRDTALANELLRGFAQAQTEVNLGLFDRNDELAQNLPGQDLLDGRAIKGFGLKILIADSANNEEQAQQIANLLSQKRNIRGVVGSFSSEVTMAMVDILNSNNLVLISPGSTTKEVTEEPRKYFFRLVGNTKLEAESLANYLIQKGLKQAAIFYNPRSPFTYSLWKDFKEIFEQKGGKVLQINQFDLTKSSFNAEKAIKELQSKGETAIVLFPDGEVTDAQKNAINIIKENNGRNWIVGASTLYSAKTLEIGEIQALEKLVIFQQWHRHDSPEFSAKSCKLWKGYINENTALAYDAIRTLIEALSKSKKPTRKGIQQTLADPNFKVDGVTGEIQFDSPNSGDRKNPPVRLVGVKKEYGLKFVPIEEQVPKNDIDC